MILNPEVQRKAQEEVDNVLGKNSLPTFADLPKLKYVDAVKKECMRQNPQGFSGNLFLNNITGGRA